MTVRRTAAALLAAALLLVGCSDDPEPRFESPPSSSPSEPQTSAEPDAQTPEEFIREWFELNTEMQNSGETAEFMAASQGCGPCATLAKRVTSIYDSGGAVRLDRQEVDRVKSVASAADLEQFNVTVSASPTFVRETPSGTFQRLPGGPNLYRVTIVAKDDRWLMQNLLDVN